MKNQAQRKLSKPAHYAAVVGKEIEIRLFAPVNGEKKLTGILKSFEEPFAEIEIDGVTVKNSRRVTAEKGKAVVSFCGCGGEGIRFGAYGQSGNHVL